MWLWFIKDPCPLQGHQATDGDSRPLFILNRSPLLQEPLLPPTRLWLDNINANSDLLKIHPFLLCLSVTNTSEALFYWRCSQLWQQGQRRLAAWYAFWFLLTSIFSEKSCAIYFISNLIFPPNSRVLDPIPKNCFPGSNPWVQGYIWKQKWYQTQYGNSLNLHKQCQAHFIDGNTTVRILE